MVRAWSAISRRAMSPRSDSPRRWPVTDCASSTSADEGVGRVEGGAARQHREDALEPGAGVDVLAGQVAELTVGPPEVLGEHQVPDLDVAVLGRGVGGAALGPDVGPVVPEDLGGRAARAGLAHLPEVVLVEALDARAGEADLVGPDLLGLVVAHVDGDPEAVAVEPEHLGDELPGPGDGLGLEVVAEAEVAQHLEEAEVPRRPTDGVEVVVLATGPHAALHRRRPAAGCTAPPPRRGSRGRTASSPSW